MKCLSAFYGYHNESTETVFENIKWPTIEKRGCT